MRRTLTTGLSICAMVALSLSTLTHAAPAGAAAFVEAAMNGNRDAVRDPSLVIRMAFNSRRPDGSDS